ncbi:peptidoglycan-binding LysM [Gottschalkia acidurici 9a]|uniref:Peptidoglycan-binding LysM n=1 Tax=Gottschalkia acidurici (strain ATCC 7906 / DSM 604 / BCRC 14475 / CIP 104303 / KCTC 5404 / NCIMB 10678 / 9a) TaxID=1128398 RepID=K0AYG8_GOTA9|nr:LysM peptidoglycan-binding domain-containing protein [Gottschalkia acidurici]AFS77421.1 peptidoglycan-binding LysM [Gottschalkia acidurici 9a]
MLNIRCPEGTRKYRVRPGDTLSKIAMDFNISVPILLILNPTINPYNLSVGQEICVPLGGESTCPNGFFHTVRRGDDFYRIAQQYGLTVRELREANPFVDPYALHVGQRICIPRRERRCPAGSREYEVRRGDTLHKIAINFNVSYNSLVQANPGVNFNNLRVGQKLCIPPSRPSTVCPRGTTSYIIRANENLTSIAEKFTVSVSDLLRANPHLSPSEFVQGRHICIPRATNV